MAPCAHAAFSHAPLAPAVTLPNDPFAVHSQEVQDPTVADTLTPDRLNTLLLAGRPSSKTFLEQMDTITRRELLAFVLTYLLAHRPEAAVPEAPARRTGP